MLADAGLAQQHRALGAAHQQGEDREERQRDPEQQHCPDDVGRALGVPRVRALVEVQHAHEPRPGQVADGNAAERVLVELCELEHPEAGRGRFEELGERLGTVAARCERDEVRLGLGDDAPQLGRGAEHERAAILRVLRVVDHADQLEARLVAGVQLADQLGARVARPDDQKPGGRRERPGHDGLPGRDEQQDHGCHGERRADAERERRQPHAEGGGGDQAEERAADDRDPRPKRVQRRPARREGGVDAREPDPARAERKGHGVGLRPTAQDRRYDKWHHNRQGATDLLDDSPVECSGGTLSRKRPRRHYHRVSIGPERWRYVTSRHRRCSSDRTRSSLSPPFDSWRGCRSTPRWRKLPENAGPGSRGFA